VTRPSGGGRFRRAALVAVAAAVGPLLTGCFSAPPQIISLDPNRGSTGVAADAPIRVIFDRPVVHDSVARRFSLDPNLPGCDPRLAFTAPATAPCSVQWLPDQPGFVFVHPGTIFRANTTYTIDVGSGVEDTSGTINSLDHRWDITSNQAPALVAAEPSDGSLLPRDAPLTMNFSRPMDESTMARAVSIDPKVAGTRVIRNARDHGRFLILPGTLLEPDTTYTLSVDSSATDEHRAPLGVAVTVHFHTAAIRAADHAVILANRAGKGATDVALSRLAPLQFGEPIPSATLVTAPTCTAGPCGLVAHGAPLVTFRDAQLAPGSRWLALVEADETIASAPPRLRVIDLATATDRTVVPGARFPAWSPDGDRLAFADAGGGARLYTPGSDAFSGLPGGGALVGRPVWLQGGESLALPTQGQTTTGIDLAVPALAARSPLPVLSGRLDDPVAGPDGSLAVRARADSGSTTWVAADGGSSPPAALPGNRRPLGFLDSGRLLCVDDTSHALVVVTVATREEVAMAQAPPSEGVSTIVVARGGRQIAYIAASAGIAQAVVANSDGSGPIPLTSLGPGLAAISVSFQ